MANILVLPHRKLERVLDTKIALSKIDCMLCIISNE